jgi:hypothetical protein
LSEPTPKSELLGPSSAYSSSGLAPRFGEESIRYLLAIIAVTAIWSGVHKFLSARSLPADLAGQVGSGNPD